MDDPDVVLRIDREADRLAEDPVVGQRLGPQRIHFEPRRHHGRLRRDSRSSRRSTMPSASRAATKPRPDEESSGIRHSAVDIDIRVPAASLRDELLHALALERFTGVDVALRVHGHAADAVERARIAAAVAEAADHDGQRVAAQDEDLLVVAVGDVTEALLRIPRERDVPDRSGALRGLRDDALLQELAGLVEGLDAVVPAIADVDRPVLRDLRRSSPS